MPSVRVIFDLDVSPAFFCSGRSGDPGRADRIAVLVDVLKPCKAAARELTGEGDYEKLPRICCGSALRPVAITLGADGCLLATPKKSSTSRHSKSKWLIPPAPATLSWAAYPTACCRTGI